MSRKKIYIIAGIVILGIIGTLFFINKNKDEEPITGLTPLHNNIQFPGQDSDSLYFFSGSFFGKYNLENHKVTRLSDFLLIDQDIGQLKWSEKGVLFSSKQSTSTLDDLSESIRLLGASKAETYWWQYDFVSKQYQLLDRAGAENCQDLFRRAETGYICLPLDANSQAALKITEIPTLGSAKELYKGNEPIRDAKVIGDDLYFVSTSLSGSETISKLNLSSKQVSKVHSSEGTVVSYQPDEKNKILIVWNQLVKGGAETDEHPHDNEKSSYNIVLLANGKEVSKTKLSAVRINAQGNDEGLFLANSNGDIYQEINNKIKLIVKKEADTNDARAIFVFKNKWYYVSNTGELLGEESAQDPDIRPLYEFDVDADNDPSASFYINKPDEDATTDVQLYEPSLSFAQQAEHVEKILKDDLFDPSMFKFVWSINSSDFVVPVQPNSILVR